MSTVFDSESFIKTKTLEELTQINRDWTDKDMENAVKYNRDDVFEFLYKKGVSITDDIVNTVILMNSLKILINIYHILPSFNFNKPEFIFNAVMSRNKYCYEFIIERYKEVASAGGGLDNNIEMSVYQIINTNQPLLMKKFMKNFKHFYDNKFYYYSIDNNKSDIYEFLEDYLYDNNYFDISVLKECLNYRKTFDRNIEEHRYYYLIKNRWMGSNQKILDDSDDENELIDPELEDEMNNALYDENEMIERNCCPSAIDFNLDNILDNSLNEDENQQSSEVKNIEEDEENKGEELTFENILERVKTNKFLDEYLDSNNVENTFLTEDFEENKNNSDNDEELSFEEILEKIKIECYLDNKLDENGIENTYLDASFIPSESSNDLSFEEFMQNIKSNIN